MRKTRAQAQRLHIGPTKRPGDLVCLLFSRLKCGPLEILSKLILPSFQDNKPRFSATMPLVINLSKGNAPAEDW